MRNILKCLLLSCCLFLFLPTEARTTYNFNSGWVIDHQKMVTLPHAWNENDAFRVSIHQLSTGVVWYRKSFRLPKSARGKHVFIEFEGARQAAEVFLNGKRVGLNENGVMAFGFEITPFLKKGINHIAVRTDNSWKYKEQSTGTLFQWNNNNFYANYGGLNKNVWLQVTDDVYQTLPLYHNLGTTGEYIYASDFDIPGHTAVIHAESQVMNTSDHEVREGYTVIVEEMNGHELGRFSGSSVVIPAHQSAILKASDWISGLHFWSWGYGYLYRVKTIVGKDTVTTVTGFRKTDFKNGMFYLNNRVLMVHGYAQRSTNEWPGVGSAVPAWLSDYSNHLVVQSNGNLVRWMHVTPGKQDIQSCDRVGLLMSMPAGDAEKDISGRQWEQREELMRDAIIYNRNDPSIIFYECGNKGISEQHMAEMKAIRNQYDPSGGRAIGSREMLQDSVAEYGGEMLYVNKSDRKPMWMMEYCRDEGLRWYWNSWSYPFHKEGDGPLYRNAPANAYNHNQDEFAAELVRRWYDFWQERPGSGTKVCSGGVKIVFSDTQTHGRSAENYRVSGVVDPMRIPKDAFFVHQAMWDGWVDDLAPHTYIVGHWNYKKGQTIPVIYVVSTSDSVVLFQNNKAIFPDARQCHFLYVFNNVPYQSAKLMAVGYGNTGKEESHYTLQTSGKADHLRLTPIVNPTGWKADGNDVALVQVEVVDHQGCRCPLDNRLIHFSVSGPAEWRGGLAEGKDNHVLCDTLPVECGINRVMLRSFPKAGKVTVKAEAEGLASVSLTLATLPVKVKGGLSSYMSSDGLRCHLERGETPSTPSFKPWRKEVPTISAVTGCRNCQSGSHPEEDSKLYSSVTDGCDPKLSYDGFENTAFETRGGLDSAWITYTLAENTRIDDICLKLKDFRSVSYPIAVYAGKKKVWEGWTQKSLGFVHLPLKDAPVSNTYTIRLLGRTSNGDAFGAVKELDNRNNEKQAKGFDSLKILEIEFLRNL